MSIGSGTEPLKPERHLACGDLKLPTVHHAMDTGISKRHRDKFLQDLPHALNI